MSRHLSITSVSLVRQFFSSTVLVLSLSLSLSLSLPLSFFSISILNQHSSSLANITSTGQDSLFLGNFASRMQQLAFALHLFFVICEHCERFAVVFAHVSVYFI